MSLTKRRLKEREERGLAEPASDLSLCPQHVEDAYLKQKIAESAGLETLCAFCDEEPVRDAPLAVLCYLISSDLHRLYETAANAGVPRDEGEWVYAVQDTYDIVYELCADGGVEPDVSDRIVDLFDAEAWYPKFDVHDSPDAPLREGWKRFCEHVKHESRFLLKPATRRNLQPHPTLEPRDTLERLAEVIVDMDLLTTLPAASLVYRARAAELPEFESIRDFTSPPSDLAAQGRMNPTGISMFYGALEPETAAVEVYGRLPHAAVANFHDSART